MTNKIRNNMNIIKKGIGFLLLSLMLVPHLFARENISTVIIVTNTMGIRDADRNYISTSVKGKFKELLAEYTNFEIVDDVNESTIIKLQRKSESAAFSEESAIEVGNLTSAKHGFFINIIQRDSSFRLSLDVSNLETGKIVTTENSTSVYNIDDLYANPGSPVHDIIIKLCNKLDIFLSTYDIQALKQGENSLSEEDRSKRMLEEQKEDKRKRDELLRKKEALSSSELNSDIERQRLDAELAILEAKQKRDEERQRKYEEDKARAKEREILLAKKSSEQMAKSKERREELEQIEKEVLALQMSNKSIMGQINVIENRKRALLEIRQNIEDEKELLKYEAEEDCKNKHEDIMNAPAPKAQKDRYGNLIPEVIVLRDKEYNQYKNERMATMKEDIDKISKSIKSKENEMLEKITDDYLILRNRKANSLTKDLSVSYGSWDGISKSWDLYIDFEVEGNLLFSERIPLSYTTVTGKEVDVTSQEYIDNVDIYDGLFLSNSPAFTYELIYDVVPESRNKPSTYTFIPKKLMFYDTRTVELDNTGDIITKKGKELPCPKKEFTIYSLPKFSLTNFQSFSFKYPLQGNERRTLLSFDLGSTFKGLVNGFTIGGELSIGINKYFFASVGGGILLPYGYDYVHPYIFYSVPVTSKYSGYYISLDAGANCYIHMGSFVPNIYASVGGSMKNVTVTLNDGKKIDCLQFAPKATLGLDIPINKMFTITTNASVEWAKQTGIGIDGKVGISYVIPELHIFK